MDRIPEMVSMFGGPQCGAHFLVPPRCDQLYVGEHKYVASEERSSHGWRVFKCVGRWEHAPNVPGPK